MAQRGDAAPAAARWPIDSDGRTLRLAFAALAAALACWAYQPSLGYGFVNWDDPEYVTANPYLARPPLDFARWAATTTYMGSWHPLTWVSLRFDLSRGGGHPRAFHATNVALHALNSALVVLAAGLFLRASAARRAPGARAAPLFLGAVFAVHPLHVESVAWVSERKDVLFAGYWLLALIAYLRYLAPSPRPRLWYGASLALFLAALASKPMAIVFVPLLFLLDFWPNGRLRQLPRKTLLLEKAPFLLAGLAIGILTLAGHRQAGAVRSLDQVGILRRASGAAWDLGFYLAQSLVPHDLSPLYPLSASLAPSASQAAGFAAFVAWCLAGWRLHRRVPGFGWSALVFAALLSPTLGLLQAGQPTADRYTYLALVVPAAVLTGVALHAGQRFPAARILLLLFGATAVTLLFVRTRDQLHHWSDTPTLWARVLELAPGHPTALYNLGEHARAEGDLKTASRYWEAATAADPRHSRAQNQLGNVALLAGDLAGAEDRYRRAIEADSLNVEAIYNLAIVLDRQGKVVEAASWLARFLREAGPEFEPQLAWARSRLSQLGDRPQSSTQSSNP